MWHLSVQGGWWHKPNFLQSCGGSRWTGKALEHISHSREAAMTVWCHCHLMGLTHCLMGSARAQRPWEQDWDAHPWRGWERWECCGLGLQPSRRTLPSLATGRASLRLGRRRPYELWISLGGERRAEEQGLLPAKTCSRASVPHGPRCLLGQGGTPGQDLFPVGVLCVPAKGPCLLIPGLLEATLTVISNKSKISSR